MRVLVTGASGFVGQSLCSTIRTHGYSVYALVRSIDLVSSLSDYEVVSYADIGLNKIWSDKFRDISCVIHLAARTHVMNETEQDVLSAYREVNVEGTKRLAEQAADAGVKSFIFLSSIKVNGERTIGSNSFNAANTPRPEDAYGISKWEAEQALSEIAQRTGLEVVVIRPPLVYGPGVKRNLLRLMSMIYRGYPLPLGLVSNQRSLIGLDNLVDLIIQCVEHPHVAGKTLLASDGEDLSTSELIRILARAMDKPARLLPIPVSILRTVGALSGKRDEIDRLVGSLRVDSSLTRELLGWRPPVSVKEGLRKMAQWYVETQSARA